MAFNLAGIYSKFLPPFSLYLQDLQVTQAQFTLTRTQPGTLNLEPSPSPLHIRIKLHKTQASGELYLSFPPSLLSLPHSLDPHKPKGLLFYIGRQSCSSSVQFVSFWSCFFFAVCAFLPLFLPLVVLFNKHQNTSITNSAATFGGSYSHSPYCQLRLDSLTTAVYHVLKAVFVVVFCCCPLKLEAHQSCLLITIILLFQNLTSPLATIFRYYNKFFLIFYWYTKDCAPIHMSYTCMVFFSLS